MVFIRKKKFERKTAEGRLIGIQADEDDVENDFFKKITISLQIGTTYLNVKSYHLRLSEVPELQKADTLLTQRAKPFIKIQYYDTVVILNGQEKIMQRASKEDLLEGFKIIGEKLTHAEEKI